MNSFKSSLNNSLSILNQMKLLLLDNSNKPEISIKYKIRKIRILDKCVCVCNIHLDVLNKWEERDL